MPAKNLPTALYTCAESRKLDSVAIREENIPGIRLMKRAGQFAFGTLMQRWPSVENIVVLGGGGNNGGDAFVVAALASRKAIPVTFLTLVPAESLTGDSALAREYALQEGVVPEPFSRERFSEALLDNTVVVDGILGTGVSRALTGGFLTAINAVNEAEFPVLALDLPSGLCGDTGRQWGTSVVADATATFISLKRGLLTGRAPAVTGSLFYSDLELPETCFQKVQAECTRICTSRLRPLLPAREADAHKGRFGHLLVVGGDLGMGGAAALAGEAAARSGAGLTSIATHPDHVSPILARCPELMVRAVPSGQSLEPILEKPDVIVLGPGLGRDSWSEQMLQQSTLTELPLVMDADALNMLAEDRVVRSLKRDNWVLTPHPGEAARLLGCSIEKVQQDRFAAAKSIQGIYGGVVVLKGAGTIIASGDQCLLAAVGNPGMAAGGMGDVLSGVIGALIAQGLSLKDAAGLAVCVHGDAADLCVESVGERGVFASDLIPYIRRLLN